MSLLTNLLRDQVFSVPLRHPFWLFFFLEYNWLCRGSVYSSIIYLDIFMTFLSVTAILFYHNVPNEHYPYSLTFKAAKVRSWQYSALSPVHVCSIHTGIPSGVCFLWKWVCTLTMIVKQRVVTWNEKEAAQHVQVYLRLWLWLWCQLRYLFWECTSYTLKIHLGDYVLSRLIILDHGWS